MASSCKRSYGSFYRLSLDVAAPYEQQPDDQEEEAKEKGLNSVQQRYLIDLNLQLKDNQPFLAGFLDRDRPFQCRVFKL